MTCRTSPEVGGMSHPIKRKEDLRFIQGKGNYVDDVSCPICSMAIWCGVPTPTRAMRSRISPAEGRCEAVPFAALWPTQGDKIG